MKVFILLQSLFRRSLKNRYSLIVYTVIPILGIIIPLLIYSKNNEEVNVLIVDHDRSFVSYLVVEEIKGKYKKVNISDNDIDKSKVVNGDEDLLISIPNGLGKNLMNSKNINIQIIYMKESEDVYKIKEIVNESLKTINYILKITQNDEVKSKEIFDKINSINYKVNKEIVNYDKKDLSVESLGFIILFMMIVTNSSLALILKDKNNNVDKRLVYLDIKSREYIAAQILWSFILANIQALTIIIFFKVNNIEITINYYKLFLIIILIWSISISFSIFSISFCRNEEQLSVINTIIVFPTCMLSGCLWPIEIMQENIQKLSLILPQRRIIMLMEQLQRGDSIYIIILNISFIILISLLLLIIGIIRIENNTFKEKI